MPPAIRLLVGDDLDAANAIYARLRFHPSGPGDATLGAAEGGQLIALGRIVRHGDGALEIGGFWVDPPRRGQGLARAMVSAVLAALPPRQGAWCVPFSHLESFYLSFGMRAPAPGEPVPASIQAKVGDCLAVTCEPGESVSVLRWGPSPTSR